MFKNLVLLAAVAHAEEEVVDTFVASEYYSTEKLAPVIEEL